LDPAHRPEVAPGRALVASRVVPDVALTDAPREPAREVPRSLDERPEGVVVEQIGLREAGQALVQAQEAAHLAVAGERAVDAAQRLDPDEVAQDEHVKRDLEPLLA